MKLTSKPDDRCGNCGDAERHHRDSVCMADYRRPGNGPEDEGEPEPCGCEQFIHPIVARLVEALVYCVREYVDPEEVTSKLLPEDLPALDLLVELGRMTVENGVYKWATP